jgi:hypothetical protein
VSFHCATSVASSFAEAFNSLGLTLQRQRMLESSWRYDKSNQNLNAKKKTATMQTQEAFFYTDDSTGDCSLE